MLTSAISNCLNKQYISHCGNTEVLCYTSPIIIVKSNCLARLTPITLLQVQQLLTYCPRHELRVTDIHRQLLYHKPMYFLSQLSSFPTPKSTLESGELVTIHHKLYAIWGYVVLACAKMIIRDVLYFNIKVEKMWRSTDLSIIIS